MGPSWNRSASRGFGNGEEVRNEGIDHDIERMNSCATARGGFHVEHSKLDPEKKIAKGTSKSEV
jgi:hypothetical protein